MFIKSTDQDMKLQALETSTKQCIKSLTTEKSEDDKEGEGSQKSFYGSGDLMIDCEEKAIVDENEEDNLAKLFGGTRRKFRCMSRNCDFIADDREQLIRHLYLHEN
ncbi:hypothetical protein JTB14_013091 [Gonioctena quinquepunctata]|nr:hypothetical protein JTB14_013091 [Gonioctena quinquepunctata]